MALVTNFDSTFKGCIFIFRDKYILIQKNSLALPTMSALEKCISFSLIEHYFLETEDQFIAALFEKDAPPPKNYEFIPLRTIFAEINEYQELAARAALLIKWSNTHHFCAQCAGSLFYSKNEVAKTCIVCGTTYYPRIEPAIIVQVYKKDKILLARHLKRVSHFFTCIAGFMEAGESAEECVKREVFEETGINVKNIKYEASQSWPFPNQLMLAFSADWKSGSIKIQKEELLDADWFSKDNLPNLPPKGSLAHRLIEGDLAR